MLHSVHGKGVLPTSGSWLSTVRHCWMCRCCRASKQFTLLLAQGVLQCCNNYNCAGTMHMLKCLHARGQLVAVSGACLLKLPVQQHSTTGMYLVCYPSLVFSTQLDITGSAVMPPSCGMKLRFTGAPHGILI